MISGEFASDSKMVMLSMLKSAITISEVCYMTINNTGMKRKPTHPGEMLREDFMPDYELSVSGLAQALGVSRQSINELLRERRAVSPEMAIRLGRLFGNSAEFWLNAQRALDLWEANQALKSEVARIRPLNAA
jgi:addiction module HigA family antidote